MDRQPPPTVYSGSTRTFREKLAIFCVGIAIGLVLLGWFQVQRQKALRAEEQAKQEAASETTPADTTPADTTGTTPEPAPETTNETRDEPGFTPDPTTED